MQLKGGKTLKCPLCSCTDIQEEHGKYAFMKGGINPHGLRSMQPAFPVIIRHCGDCGHIMLFHPNASRQRSYSDLAEGGWVEPKE